MNREMKHLKFVLKYYAPGIFDTRKALRAYKSQHPSTIRYWGIYIAGVAASLILCIGIGYYLMNRNNQPSLLYADNETVTYTLPDGSIVTVYPHSSLSYYSDEFGKKERLVEMTGKVRFNVQKNPSAPFIANAQAATVKVLGTQFVVDELNPDSVGVSVTSGKVLFTAKDEKDGVILTKGMQAYLLAGEILPEIADTVTSTTQTKRKFIFENTPLADVLKELSEHFHVQLSCATTGKMLTAEFDTDNLDEIIMIIEKSLDVKIQKRPIK